MKVLYQVLHVLIFSLSLQHHHHITCKQESSVSICRLFTPAIHNQDLLNCLNHLRQFQVRSLQKKVHGMKKIMWFFESVTFLFSFILSSISSWLYQKPSAYYRVCLIYFLFFSFVISRFQNLQKTFLF